MNRKIQFEAEPFVPHPRLPGGHWQTIASNYLRRENGMPDGEVRLFSVEQDVEVKCVCHWQPERAKALTLVIVHGLEGSIESQYMIGTGTKAWRAGMNVVRMNMRNCGGSEKLGPTLYHSGLSADVGAVVRTLIEQDGLERIALVGYSMGGNLVLKMMGEWSESAPKQVIAAVGVSPAMDLGPSADALHEPKNRLYEYNFLLRLCRSVRKKMRLFPERYPIKDLWKLRSIRDFDEYVTAPYSGFAGADDYYNRASSSRVLEKIARPTLIIHAKDDPFIRVMPETIAKIEKNPNIYYVEPEHGGHCAFIGANDGYDGRWAERQTIRFFEQVAAAIG